MFGKNIIDCVEILKHFGKIQKFYNIMLEQSVQDQISAGVLDKVIGKDFYNYILIGGENFFAILEQYKPGCQEIGKGDFKELKKCSF